MPAYAEEFADTDPRVMEVWLDILRRRSAEEKIAMVFQMSEFAIRLSESGARARVPQAGEQEIFLRAAALRLPKDLMTGAYGWHPDQGPFPQ